MSFIKGYKAKPLKPDPIMKRECRGWYVLIPVFKGPAFKQYPNEVGLEFIDLFLCLFCFNFRHWDKAGKRVLQTTIDLWFFSLCSGVSLSQTNAVSDKWLLQTKAINIYVVVRKDRVPLLQNFKFWPLFSIQQEADCGHRRIGLPYRQVISRMFSLILNGVPKNGIQYFKIRTKDYGRKYPRTHNEAIR